MMSLGNEPRLEAVGDGEIGRLTWIGLILAAIGWLLLLGEIALADLLPSKLAHPIAPSFHADLIEVAKCLIGSGFALAIIGALQSGFGVLGRFFGAVLLRSGQRGAPKVEPLVAAPGREGRPYRILPDGSVEVETIVGTRRFSDMDEAREFI